MDQYLNWLPSVLRTINEALIAGVAISCFSVFLFLLGYLRKEVLARVYTLILAELAIIFTANAFSLTIDSAPTKFMLQQVQWVGFFIVHPAFYHFSLTILEMTGVKLSRGRFLSVAAVYAASFGMVGLFLSGKLYGRSVVVSADRPISQLTDFSPLIWVWAILIFFVCVGILIKAFRRTKTKTSRRRMGYLFVSAMSVQMSTTLSLFAALRFNYADAAGYWLFSVLAYLLLLLLIFLLAYSVVTFCVTWSHRVVRLRLVEWVLRGPITASMTLVLVTLVRRSARVLGINSEAWTSLLTVFSILLLEYMITVLTPLIRRNNYSGYGHEDYQMLTGLENMMIFRAELETYLESLCSVICDKLQLPGAFVATKGINGQPEAVISAGPFSESQIESVRRLAAETPPAAAADQEAEIVFADGFAFVPIAYPIAGNEESSLAIVGVVFAEDGSPLPLREVLRSAASDCAQVLWQRRYYARTYRTLEGIADLEPLQRFRSVNLLNPAEGFRHEDYALPSEVSGCVRDALTHYWGGPKLSESPLLRWRIVAAESEDDETGRINGLRKVLRAAIEKIRPDGTPSISVEWTLYNILILKFIEGRKVKEIVRKLSMSEADFYRKQKVAIEEVAKILTAAENEARTAVGSEFDGGAEITPEITEEEGAEREDGC